MMLESLHLIKLSRHINPRLGYAAEPRFKTQIWRLILNHVEHVDDVLLFANSQWSGNRQSFVAGESFSPRINSIGRMTWLSEAQFTEVANRSDEDGHFSVLYKIFNESVLLPRLINLWTTPRAFGNMLSDAARDDIGLKLDETYELAHFVHAVEATHTIASFAHNAEPLYLFGNPDALQTSLQQAMLGGV